MQYALLHNIMELGAVQFSTNNRKGMIVFTVILMALSIVVGILLHKKWSGWQLSRQPVIEAEPMDNVTEQAIMNAIMDAMRCGYTARDYGLQIKWEWMENEDGEPELYARYFETVTKFNRKVEITHYTWRVSTSAQAVVDEHPEPVMTITGRQPQHVQASNIPAWNAPPEPPEWALG